MTTTRPLVRRRAVLAFAAVGLSLATALGAQEQGHLGNSRQALTRGAPADRELRPYVAFLDLHMQNGTTKFCTGTLVSPTAILTAAHCIVCAQSVTAYIYGDVGWFDDPTPGVATLTGWPSASLAVNPAAYPVLPTCAGNHDNVFADINSKTVWGADVGVVHLAQPVPVASVAPATARLVPPRGFGPAQALRDQPLALVGRGYRDPFSTQVGLDNTATCARVGRTSAVSPTAS